jgi:Fic family protein
MDSREQKIIELLQDSPLQSSKSIFDNVSMDVSYATIKRMLSKLVEEQTLETIGQGKGTKYQISPSYHIHVSIDMDSYYKQEIDERKIKENFNPQVIKETLHNTHLFTKLELQHLYDLQSEYSNNIKALKANEYQKELERLAIDLSWKSSQIEGNTYSLLETERLLKEKETAQGKTKEEAVMLLNHKDALDFIIEHPDYLEPLTINKIEDIHSLLIKELEIDRNLRTRRVGISGTNYRPLDNEFLIRDALNDMCDLVNSKQNTFEKALLVLVLISYIQPFTDGNTRTARIVSNGILMNNKHCPISFRTVDSIEYKKAMLLFYEQNNIYNFKKIFIDQFEFAVKTYF